jgi:hypothetical protein
VPTLFTLRIEIGENVPVSLFAEATSDLSVIATAAMDLAAASADEGARRFVADLVARSGPRGLMSELRERQLPSPEVSEEDLIIFDRWDRELGYVLGMPRVPRSMRYAALFGLGAIGPSYIDGWWDSARRQLVAAETAARLPSRPYRIRSVTYASPIIANILSEVGAATHGLTELLKAIVTLGSARRSASAQADADEARARAEKAIALQQEAHARVDEARARVMRRELDDIASCRTALRRSLLEQIGRGDIQVTVDVVDKLIPGIAASAMRLADRGITIEQVETQDEEPA